ncbi:hypothetical protein ABPG74_001941 [Tetrahymena malaccensis]
MNYSTVRDYIHQKVKEIKVIVRTVDIPVIKYLGAQHMFLLLKLDNGVRVINHITDDNGGKGAKVVFEKLTKQDSIDNQHTIVMQTSLSVSITLVDVISKAKQYQIDHPTYQILSKNCQFYCISILKMLRINSNLIQLVSSHSDKNMSSATTKGAVAAIGLGVVAASIGLAIAKKDGGASQKEEETVQQEQE